MKLVLAEKPSVAMSLSKVIRANQRGDGYMEGNGYLVSWCVGHLVELSQPEAYDEKYAKWRYDDLTILPEHWQYQVSASTKKQFGILKKLMQRKDVESLICATDAGREGELIFRLVYHQCGCKKPVERLWISSMEDSAIRESFQKLRPGTEYAKFNVSRPDDFTGHSLSVSDIVVLRQNGVVSCHYVDSIGFQELPGFLKPGNYLKATEMAMEDDYGMINNGKKEEPVEKASVLEQLKEKQEAVPPAPPRRCCEEKEL